MTLVEVLFSATLLAFVVMGVLQLLPSSSIALEQARVQAHAEDIAATALEGARAKAFGSLHVDATEDLVPTTIEGTNFTGEVAVYPVPGEDVRFLKGVRVTVRWRQRDIDHSFTRQARIANVSR